MHSTNLNFFNNDLANKKKDFNCALTINISNDDFPTSSTNEALLEQNSLKENNNLFKYKMKCAISNNYANIINSTILSSETKPITPKLNNNNFENLITTQSTDCLVSNNKTYSLTDTTKNSKLGIDDQQNNIINNNNNNNFLNNNFNKNDKSTLSTQISNNSSIQLINSNYLQDSITSNTSLLGTLLAKTQQSPTVPESRTEQQSGLVGSIKYDLSNNSNNVFSSKQSSLEVQEYLLKQKNTLIQQCEKNDMLQSMLSLTNTDQVINKFI